MIVDLVELEKAKLEVAKRKEIEFSNIDIGEINTYLYDTEYLQHIQKFKLDLFKNISMYIDLHEFNTSIVSFTINNVRYEMHPANMYLNLIMFTNLFYFKQPLSEKDLFDGTNITQGTFKKYLDNRIINRFLKETEKKLINTVLTNIMYEFTTISAKFSRILGTTIDLLSDVDLMDEDKDYYDALHAYSKLDNSMTPKEIEDYLKDATKVAFNKISKHKEHCLYPIIQAGYQGLNKDQFTKYAIAVGMSPDGLGSIIPKIVKTNFISGIRTASEYFVDSQGGRVAQIITKTRTADTGDFARKISKLASDIYISKDPHSDCGTRNYLKVYIRNENILHRYIGRYRVLDDDSLVLITEKDTHLIGEEISVRSPITCANNNNEICFKCYGDLAYINNDIGAGNFGARTASEKLTQNSLSAKHILKSNSVENKFNDEFYKYFILDVVDVRINMNNENYKKYKIILKEEDVNLDEETDEYVVDKFYLSTNKKHEDLIEMKPINPGLSLSPDLIALWLKKDEDSDTLEIEIKKLEDPSTDLFLLPLVNTDLTNDFTETTALLDTNAGVQNKTYSQFTNDLIDIMYRADPDKALPMVHFECVLRNMVKSASNQIKIPDWRVRNNADYTILRLSTAIFHTGVVSALSFQKFESQIQKPSTYAKTQPSATDPLFKRRYTK